MTTLLSAIMEVFHIFVGISMPVRFSFSHVTGIFFEAKGPQLDYLLREMLFYFGYVCSDSPQNYLTFQGHVLHSVRVKILCTSHNKHKIYFWDTL